MTQKILRPCPYPCWEMSSGDTRLPASPGFNESPHFPHQNGIRKDVVDTQDFPHHLAIRPTSPMRYSKVIREWSCGTSTPHTQGGVSRGLVESPAMTLPSSPAVCFNRSWVGYLGLYPHLTVTERHTHLPCHRGVKATTTTEEINRI